MGKHWCVSERYRSQPYAYSLCLFTLLAATSCWIFLSSQYDVASGVVLLQGGVEQCQYDSDTELVFRQDSWFHYLFGVKEPGMYGLLDVSSRKSILFIPRLVIEYLLIWCGDNRSSQSFKLSYNTG